MEQCIEWRETRCSDVWVITVDEPKTVAGRVQVTLVKVSRTHLFDRVDLTITSVNGTRWVSLETGEDADIILDRGQFYLVQVKLEKTWHGVVYGENTPMAKLEFTSDKGFRVGKGAHR